MNSLKKLLFIVMLMLFCNFGVSYAASYHYATTNMTWAEFYAGEIGENASALTEKYDAVSTATTRFADRFNGFISETSEAGSVFSGVKAVQVRMSEEVYNLLSTDARYTFTDSEFTEYKDVNADGSFGEMVSETVNAEGVTIAFAGGKSNGHGNYRLNISGLSYDKLGVNLGTSYDKFLGAKLETTDGKVYGMKPLHNLWIRGNLAEQIGFCVQDFTERNGTHLSYKHTEDLSGKTITKIIYMLKNQPDPVISCNVYVKQWTDAEITASVKAKPGENVTVTFTSNDIPDGASYSLASVAKVQGRTSTPLTEGTDYTYSDGILTLINPAAGNYTANFSDTSSTPYVDIVANINASEYYATTNMTWAEFYAGETEKTSDELFAAGLDAISTPTTKPAIDRFPLLWAASNDNGTVISGEKAVQVKMTSDVYNALADKSRYTFTDEAFSEYKTVSSDGTFGKMITETVNASDAVVTLSSGASSTWGHYTLKISGADIDIGLSGDKIARNYLGATLETQSGKIYGLRHDNNLWSDADTIAFCINDDYVEPHGKGVKRSWKYTADLEGKTISKITFMLKGLPDVVINCNVYVPLLSTTTVNLSNDKVEAGTGIAIPVKFTNLPDGVSYEVVSLYSGSGRNRNFITDYTYSDSILIVNGELKPGNYTAIFRTEGYTDIALTFYVEGDHYATTNMTWAEFYAGEIPTTSAALEEAGLDAVSSPTARVAGRFTQLVSEANDIGGMDITGVKDVHVKMSEEVYQLLSKDSRYTFTDTAFTEYKEVDASGNFGEMFTEYEYVDDAIVTLSSGANSTWGNYMLKISSVDIALTSGDERLDLGALITTNDGQVYGLRHNSNLWFSAGEIALTYKEFIEPHGISRDYDYTSDLEGKTITKIQYMLKDKPDVVISCDVFMKLQSTASISFAYPEGYNAIMAGTGAPITITFNDLSEDVVYDLESVTPSIRHASALSSDLYSYSDGVLTLSPLLDAGKYKAVFTTENYSDLAVTVEIFTVDATDLLISPDNNLAGLNFLVTPKGYIDAVDEVLEANKFVNATEHTTIAENRTENYAEGVTDSGFSFDIVLNDVSIDYTAIAGFGKMFYMTRASLGSQYDAVYTAINSIPVGESGFREIPSMSALNDAGLKVVLVRPDGVSRDISAFTGAGAMFSGENIMLYYGVMAADSRTIKEGEYTLSPEGETLINDGLRDEHIRIAMYIECTAPGSGGNPDPVNPPSPESPDVPPAPESPDVPPAPQPSPESPDVPPAPSPAPIPGKPSAPAIDINNNAVVQQIINLLQAITTGVNGNTEVTELPDSSVGTERSSLTDEELALIPDNEDVAVILPIIRVTKSAVYVFGVQLDDLDAGAAILLHLMPESAANSAKFTASASDNDAYAFLNDSGEKVSTVPANKHVNIAAYLEPNVIYAPVITTSSSGSGNGGSGDGDSDNKLNDPGSSGGGCSSGFTAITLAAIVLFMKKHNA